MQNEDPEPSPPPDAEEGPPSDAHDDERKEQPLHKRKKAARTQKLTFDFLRPQQSEEDGPRDRLWDLFLDVVVPFPSLEDRMQKQAGENDKRGEEMQQLNAHFPARLSTEAARRHLDSLLLRLRNWAQENVQAPVSLLEFSERIEKLSSKPEAFDYRAELIRRYKTTDWLSEAKKREIAQKRAPDPSLDTNSSRDSNSSCFLDPPPSSNAWPAEDYPEVLRKRRAAAEAKRQAWLERRGQSATISSEPRCEPRVTESEPRGSEVLQHRREQALKRREAYLARKAADLGPDGGHS